MSLSDIPQTDIDSAKTITRALLQEKDPTLDISVGGVVDSLLVDGTALPAANAQANLDTLQASTQLSEIASGAVTVSDAVLDEYLSQYFITRNTDNPATGTVEFIVQINQTYNFPQGYRFNFGALAYEADANYTIYPVGTAGVTETSTTKFSYQMYDSETGFSYRFTIGIVALAAGTDYLRVIGDRFTVDTGFQGLGLIQAYSNFTGGQTAEKRKSAARQC